MSKQTGRQYRPTVRIDDTLLVQVESWRLDHARKTGVILDRTRAVWELVSRGLKVKKPA